MKKRNLLPLLLLCVIVSSCGSKGERTTVQSSIPQKTQNVTEVEEVGIPIYTIDMVSMQSVCETVYLMNGEKISLNKVVEETVKLFQTKNIEIEISDIKQKNGIAYISFAKDSVPVVNSSKDVEEIILESIAKSVIDNCREIEKIVFQVESDAYISENIQLGKEEIYWWK